MDVEMKNPQYGTDTLEVISVARNFNRWMYDTVKPFCSGKILEIGSGIGNISACFLADNQPITLSDMDKGYVLQLQEKFGGFQNLEGVYHLDFSDPQLKEKYPELLGQFDTVFALNVLEHVADENQAMQNAFQLLKKGGKVVILVPAFQALYNQFDVQLEHHRRYVPRSLKAVFEKSGFRVVHSQYFNFIAVFGWFVSGNVLRKKIIPNGQMRFYDRLVPLWKVIDFFTHRFAGVSVIQVGEK